MERGTLSVGALASILFTIVVCAHVAHLIWYRHDLLRDTYESLTSRAGIIQTIFSTSHIHSTATLNCTASSHIYAHTRLERQLCELLNQTPGEALHQPIITRTDSQSFPRFQLNSLFRNVSDCPYAAETFQLSEWPQSGHSAGSMVSENTCRTRKHPILGPLTIRENLILEHGGRIEQLPTINTPVIIATLGFLTSKGNLRLDTDTMIVAAGDLTIETLSAASGIRVTLLSISGRVLVAEMDGTPQLKVISLQEPQTPQGKNQVQPLTPEILPSDILSLR